VKVEFSKQELRDLYEKGETGKPKYPEGIIEGYAKQIKYIINAQNINDLYALKSLHFEKMSGFKNKYSTRINRQFRIEMLFENRKDGSIMMKIFVIQKISKHYEKG